MFELKSGKAKGAPNVLYMGVDHIHGNSMTESAQWGRFIENVKKLFLLGLGIILLSPIVFNFF